MNINWFPGHMTKAIRLMQDNLRLVDIVIYVLDSRAIKSCINPTLNNICRGKKILYLINKIDLVEESELEFWEKYFIKNKLNYIKCIGKQVDILKLIDKLNEINADKIELAKSKGLNFKIKAMVVGVPNSGKSSIINSIAKKTKLVVSNKAGVTRNMQWININNIYLIDTPGTLWGKITDQQTARNLAYIGSINDDILDFEELGYNFINDYYFELLPKVKNKYKLLNLKNNNINELISEIAEKLNYKSSKNVLDIDRTSRKIIHDFRDGNLGKIMLDKINE